MNITVKVDVEGALARGGAPEVIQRCLESAVTETTMFLYGQVLARTPQGVFGAQGGLMASIQPNVLQKGTPLVKGVVASAHKYAEVVEKGRRAGKGIPVDDLVRWVEVKLGITDPKIVRSVAFLISRHAKKYGIVGAHMFERALSDNYEKVEAIFNKVGLAITKGIA
jgi:hypothetical protein